MVIESDMEKDPNGVKIYSESQVTIDTKESVARALERHIEQQRLDAYSSIDSLREIIHYISNVNVDVSTIKLTEDGAEKESSAEVTMIAALVFAMLIYFFVLIYGTQVMRGVMEEKTNRIVEVMISTVKPAELMFGKIIGVGLVGLFQVIIWCITTPLFIFLITYLMSGSMDMSASMPPTAVGDTAQMETMNSMMGDVMSQLAAVNWWIIIPTIFLFFLLGYLMYSSLFAAIGSSMGDDQGEGQSLTFLVIMPLLFGFYISISALQSPNSDLAVWSSMIPLFSPIVMPVRMAFEPPTWQIITSLILLFLASLFFAWLSARIYRVGILMYGKKATFKDLVKWFKSK